jgi:4-oxalocrotonate tautomerase
LITYGNIRQVFVNTREGWVLAERGDFPLPLVTIKMFEGRTIEQKRGMVRDVTDAIVKNIGCERSAITIDIVDLKKENVAAGGELFSDKT